MNMTFSEKHLKISPVELWSVMKGKLMIRHLTFVLLSGLIFILISCGTVPGHHMDERMNFIIIFADDQGYQDLGCFGSPGIKTPNIDKMAREGMKFTDFYAQPLCGPSRTALLTGCYPMRVAEYGNEKRKFPYVHAEEILLPKQLQLAGYKTGMIGKVDITMRKNGWKSELNPVHRGFDFFFGTVGANDGGRPREMYRNEIVEEKRLAMDEITKVYTKEALDYIERNKSQPFLLYIAHTMPHVALGASEQFKGKSARGLYGDVMEELDWSTGEILNKLGKLKLDRKTIVVYLSDNGPYFLQKAVDAGHAGSALPLRGSKGTTWEGGMRVPCVMWAPGLIPAGMECHEVATTMDLFPTFIAVAGAEIPGDRVIDGKDISPLMKGRKDAKSPHRAFYYYMESELEAVRSGKWKMVFPRAHVKERPWLSRSANYQKFIPGVFDGVSDLQLYDLENDASEQHNLADQYPEVIETLMEYAEMAYRDLGNFDRIGEGARFFEDGARWPNLSQWREIENE